MLETLRPSGGMAGQTRGAIGLSLSRIAIGIVSFASRQKKKQKQNQSELKTVTLNSITSFLYFTT
ncbi:MAG TPA: hypothetical protein VFF57_04655 [Hanamia sp.]|nr:hypothetical protein [Hanamia sp.]